MDLKTKCSDFVESHNKVNLTSIGTRLQSMLKDGVDTAQLFEILKSKEKKKYKVVSITVL